MGQGTNSLDEPSPEELREKVDQSRERLDSLVSELDQRRHVVSRIKKTVGEHRAWAIGGGIATAGIVAAAIALAVQHQRRRQRFTARAHRWLQAFGKMINHPDRVARRDPNAAGKIMTSAASTATSTVVKRLIGRLLTDTR